MVLNVWDLIERKTLNKAWNNILKSDHENSITDIDDCVMEDINEPMPGM